MQGLLRVFQTGSKRPSLLASPWSPGSWGRESDGIQGIVPTVSIEPFYKTLNYLEPNSLADLALLSDTEWPNTGVHKGQGEATASTISSSHQGLLPSRDKERKSRGGNVTDWYWRRGGEMLYFIGTFQISLLPWNNSWLTAIIKVAIRQHGF